MAKPTDIKPASAEPEQVSSAPPSAPAKQEAKPKAAIDDREAAEVADAAADKAQRAAIEAEFTAKLAEGKAATLHHREAAAAKPALVHLSPALAPPTALTYQVWPHGTLQRNGKTYQPGDTLTLDPAEASKIPCLVRVES